MQGTEQLGHVALTGSQTGHASLVPVDLLHCFNSHIRAGLMSPSATSASWVANNSTVPAERKVHGKQRDCQQMTQDICPGQQRPSCTVGDLCQGEAKLADVQLPSLLQEKTNCTEQTASNSCASLGRAAPDAPTEKVSSSRGSVFKALWLGSVNDPLLALSGCQPVIQQTLFMPTCQPTQKAQTQAATAHLSTSTPACNSKGECTAALSSSL